MNTAGAIKQLIEGASLGVLVVRDRLPKRYRLPAVVIQEAVDTPVDQHGDFGDPDAAMAVSETVILDLFEMWRTSQGQVGESLTLASDLTKLLHGSTLPGHSKRVYGVRVLMRTRIPAVDLPDKSKMVDNYDQSNVVHTSYTLLVNREL